MSKSYVVQQGDHLSKIAATFGFLDYNVIWSHPQNAALKRLRQNPNVLLPGDTLVIPDKQPKDSARGTDAAHRFQIHLPTLKLHLKLQTRFGPPLSNQKYRLAWQNTVRTAITNGEGGLEQLIPSSTESTMLHTLPAPNASDLMKVPLQVGCLDPVTEVSGWRARLNNLGYDAGDDPLPDPPPGQKAQQVFALLPPEQQERLRSAIEEFQCDNHLVVDGKCGTVTQAKLKAVHGC